MGLEYLQKVEEDEDELELTTDIECACCMQEIEADEEAVLLQIVQSQRINGQTEYYPVLKDTDGDYQFGPLFVHLDGCWKDVLEGIQERVSDVPPLEDGQSIIKCFCCESGIREWEYLALGQCGEFTCNPRTPSNKLIYNFIPWGGKDATTTRICVACIARISEETLEDWSEVSQFGECVFCAHARCWRNGSCECFCHMDESNG